MLRYRVLLNNWNRSLFFVIALLFVIPCFGKIYYSKKEAMVLAFGEGASVEMLSLFPTDTEKRRIEKLARVKLRSAFFTFYVGKKNGEISGYAAIENHKVRTKPETLLIVLTKEGQLRDIHTLAFHEPPEYQPPARWFAQLYHRPIDEMSFSTGIQAMTGATLSTRAALASVRKVLAIYQVEIKEKQP